MSALCPTACASIPDVVQSYFDCIDRLRRYGFNHFVLIDCQYQFVDISDPDEWAAAIAADDIRISPPGSLIIQPAEATSFVIEGCGRENPGLATYNIDFTTYQTRDGALAHTQNTGTPHVPQDVHYWQQVFNNSSSAWKMLFVECASNRFYVSDGWMEAALARAADTDPITIAGVSPGFDFSVSTIPGWVEGEQNFGVWSTQFRIKKVGVMEQLILPGIKDVLA